MAASQQAVAQLTASQHECGTINREQAQKYIVQQAEALLAVAQLAVA
jgi:hypothetical protein